MLLKPAVLKGSLATGFGVGAGPGVPGDPKTSRIYTRPSVGPVDILWSYYACGVSLTKSIKEVEANLASRKCWQLRFQRRHPQTLSSRVVNSADGGWSF